MSRRLAFGGGAPGGGGGALTAPLPRGAIPGPGAVRASAEAAVDVRVRGVVQGVGFRPFVHRLALRHDLAGWVRNERGAVRLHLEGAAPALRRALVDLRVDAPPLARIEAFEVREVTPRGEDGFRVLPSDAGPEGRLPVPPDVATCSACEAEVGDSRDRRWRYPFTTCTDCGPRYTVVEALPYDRARTSMAPFGMCPACAAEYADPASRRYHSETNACPACGPRVWLGRASGAGLQGDHGLLAAAEALRSGRIVAVKGVGGFHLAADATDELAVRRLRARKHRDAKPLAVMVRTVAEAGRLGDVGPSEAALLTSRERPIVLLRRRAGSPLAAAVAPGLDTVGVMLAYAPLHHLVLGAVGRPLVMTSGNATDEPIAAGNVEAERSLGSIADAFLFHDRDVVARCDDSVVRATAVGPVILRRARGWAPLPAPLPVPAAVPLLAVGAHLKSTFALADGGEAWVSPHLGDLEGLETLEHYRATLEHYRRLFRVEPRAVARDLHPGYLSTRIAGELAGAWGVERVLPVQHHHAHAAAVLAEHGRTGPAVALTLDGTGHGDDGHTWGAEVLVADLRAYRRSGRLRYAPLPGGDLAARRPWRVASGYLSLEPAAAGAFARAFDEVPPEEAHVARVQVLRGLNAPMASSLGRLFDAAAAVLGVRRVSLYEGHAAMELEALAGRRPAAPLPFPAEMVGGVRVLDPLPLLVALGERLAAGDDVRDLAAAFHESVAAAYGALATAVAREEGLDAVALCGGCFQNARLLEGVTRRLEAEGLTTLLPRRFGPNDGAVSYGQAAVAAAHLSEG